MRDRDRDYDHLFKFVLVGDAGVGKSSFNIRLTDDTFSSRSVFNPYVDFKLRSIDIDGKFIKSQVWDLPPLGSTPSDFRDATHIRVNTQITSTLNGVILCCDVTNRQSYDNIPRWLDEIEKYYWKRNGPIFLVGTKCDLEGQRAVSRREVEAFAKKHGLTYMETSAKTGIGVEETFRALVTQSLAKLEAKEQGAEKEKEKEKDTKKEAKPKPSREERKQQKQAERQRKAQEKQEENELKAKDRLEQLKGMYQPAFTALDNGTTIKNEKALKKMLNQGEKLLKNFRKQDVHPHLQAEANYHLGRAAGALGDKKSALKYFNNALKLGDTKVQEWAQGRIDKLTATPQEKPISRHAHMPAPPVLAKKEQEKEERYETFEEYLEAKTGQKFIDPISQEAIKDLVVSKYGHNYDRTSIETWLDQSKTCPITRQPLTKDDGLYPNYSLKEELEKHRENFEAQKPQEKEQDETKEKRKSWREKEEEKRKDRGNGSLSKF